MPGYPRMYPKVYKTVSCNMNVQKDCFGTCKLSTSTNPAFPRKIKGIPEYRPKEVAYGNIVHMPWKQCFKKKTS